MKILLLLPLFLLAGCVSSGGFPTKAFTFVGIPERVRDGSYQTVEGRVCSFQIRVVEVKKGTYSSQEIGFDFPEGSDPPLQIGKRYQFTAVYDRHGIRYTDWKEEEPIQPPQPTPGLAPRRG